MTAENRRRAFTDEELTIVAERMAEAVNKHNECRLTPEQQDSIISLLNTRRNAIRVTLWLSAAIGLLAVKGAYDFISTNIHILWGAAR